MTTEAPTRKRGLFWVLLGVAALVVLLLLVTGVIACPGEGALLGPVGIPVAFVVGAVSFFSPCILPLLPGYLSFVSGLTGEEIEGAAARRRLLAGTSLFVLGFATLFTALGAAASLVGGWLNDHLLGITRIAGVIVVLMGLAFVVPGLMRFMEVDRRPLLGRVKPGVGGAYPLGFAFAAGWTPCVSPGLGVLLTLGAVEGSVVRGAVLLFAFSLGFGIWFILGGLGVRRALVASAWMRQRTRAIQVVGGVMMLAIGVLLVTDRWSDVMSPIRRLVLSVTTNC